MNYKTWLIAFGVVAALVVGGSGFYAFSGYGKYSESLENWNNKVGTIESLERRVPYPNKQNSEELGGTVKAYETSVDELFTSLDSFQSDLNVGLDPSEFQREVKDKVQAFRKYADEAGFKIDDSMDFQLGFDDYSTAIPSKDLVAVLDYELEAIDYLMRALVDVGISDLSSFERDPIPGEAGAPAEHPSNVVHKYPVRMRFTGKYDAFQSLINQLANDKKFFYIVRVLKVKNEMTEGPQKLSEAALSTLPSFSNPDTQEVAGIDLLTSWGYPDVSDSELSANAGNDGFISSNTDARVLMGQESLDVFMVVDIVRFISPQEIAANQAEKANSNKDEDRRR